MADAEDKLRAEAERLAAEADRLEAEARETFAIAMESIRRLREAVATLTGVVSSGNGLEVTKAQIDRRGASVARTRAEASGNKVQLAISGSRWKSLTRYARGRLRISQPTLSRYLSGDLEVPPEVADAIRRDFGLGDDAWPRPPRR